MGRLTERDEYGNADIIGVNSIDLQGNLEFGELNRVTDALNKLAEYEELEEQGKLLKQPAAIGEEIFLIFMDCPKDYKEKYCRDHEGSCENCHHRVPEVVNRDFRVSDICNIDKIFATREEAEAVLEELME